MKIHTPLFAHKKLFTVSLLVLIVGVWTVVAHSDQRDCPRIKLKRQWGGKPATDLAYQVKPIKYVVIHHTTTTECDAFTKCADILQAIQTYHMNNLDFPDIGYNFLIGNDGLVYTGTGWGVRGSHTYGYNMNGTGIAFIGNFIEKLPSPSALQAAKDLLSCGVKKGELDPDYRLLGGSQVLSTQSPGLTLYNEIQEWDHWVVSP